jgi:hypothetical protein
MKIFKQLDTWYVSFFTDGDPRRSGRKYARATRAFRTEADAKAFAREIVENGWTATAGTLNPHLPKRTVSPDRVLDWIGKLAGSRRRSRSRLGLKAKK